MTCASFLQSFADWAKGEAVDESRYLAFFLVSNDKGGPARYAEGSLYLKTLTFQGLEVSSFFKGEANLYESNERWGFPPPPGTFGGTPYPFAPSNDKIQVHIDVSTGQVKLTSATKGQALIGNPQCEGSLIFGFATEGSGALGVGGTILSVPVEHIPHAGIGGSEVSNIGGSGQGTDPVHPGTSFQLPVVRPYYVISFQQITVDLPT